MGGIEVGLVYREREDRDISHKPCHTGDLSDVGVEHTKIYNLQYTSNLTNSLKCLHGSHVVAPNNLHEKFSWEREKPRRREMPPTTVPMGCR